MGTSKPLILWNLNHNNSSIKRGKRMQCRHDPFLLKFSPNSKDSMTIRQCGNGTKRNHKGILSFIKNLQILADFRFPDNYSSTISLIFSQISAPLFEKHMCKTDYKTIYQAKDEKWWAPVCD